MTNRKRCIRRTGCAALRRVGVCVSMMLCLVVTSQVTHAQRLDYAEQGTPPDPGLELLQEEPHDIIFFTEEAGGGWARTLPLDFPGRRPPSNPDGDLRFQVLGVEGKEMMAKWKAIAKIDLWEVKLEKEARERIAAGDFVGAYPFLSVLIRDFPNQKGLRELRSGFLWQDAISRAKRGEIAATLAMLEELRRYAPEYQPRSVVRALSGTADRLMQQLVDAGKLDLAQQMLARLEKEYQNDRLDAVTKWNKNFFDMASRKRDEAIAARDADDFRLARKLVREAIYLEPDLPGAKALMRQIHEIYPMVNVGVLQSATVLEPTRIDNWAARRAGRLMYRTLFEIQGAGPEGGEYDFIFGDTEMSPDRMHFDLLIEPEKVKPPLDKIRGFYLADVMAKRAIPGSPDYFAPWAAAVHSIELVGPSQVGFNLRRPHVLPISLLQISVDGSWFGGQPGSPTGDYRPDKPTDPDGKAGDSEVVRYVLRSEPKTPTQPREIVETRLLSGSEGVGRLLQGEVDVLDQLFPADAIRLSKSKSVKVVKYPLPTVHMLVPCSDHPYLAERTFRRALLYGINRQDILSGELLEGLQSEGCRVLSGPFPAGIELNDPLGYAYDQNIDPRPYEPPLAKLLLAMNFNQMKSFAARSKKEVAEMTPIRLAFPADNLSRVACEAIRSQWELLDLEVELVELPIGRTFPDREENIADIVYVSAAVWEPVIDARRVLGPEGMAQSSDQLVGLGLRRLEEAKNWREVRDRLLDLHAISHHELPVLPLWQMVDSYAYRRELVGMGSDIVSLYQNASNWRLGQ
ncbi:ABC transporter substrate-binding protein [Rubripirellula lacrimiformis]|nr:ABC transporter substrate-binding protein [Rubripirellula lacrimiformis]